MTGIPGLPLSCALRRAIASTAADGGGGWRLCSAGAQWLTVLPLFQRVFDRRVK